MTGKRFNMQYLSGVLIKAVGIHREEAGRAFLMFAYLFLVIASLLIFKPVSTSLFLMNLGYEQLAWAYILVAAVSAVVVPLYTRFTSSARIVRLNLGSILVTVVSLLIIWVILKRGNEPDWFLYTFYVLVALVAVFLTTQFWLLANYVFDVREARRVFGFLGAGGIAGGITGGYL
ncbi:MFS transporter, partial [bacterium]|nr:MFS transporter [bacterium]